MSSPGHLKAAFCAGCFAASFVSVSIAAYGQPGVTANPQTNIRVFHADLTPESEPEFREESKASGKADFTLNLDTKQIKWTMTYSGLASEPVDISVNGPAPRGQFGGFLFNLAPNGMKSPIAGSATLSDGQIQYLLYGWTYVNIRTKDANKGEIRGQMDIQTTAR